MDNANQLQLRVAQGPGAGADPSQSLELRRFEAEFGQSGSGDEFGGAAPVSVQLKPAVPSRLAQSILTAWGISVIAGACMAQGFCLAQEVK